MKIEDFAGDTLPFFSVNRSGSAVEPITLESVKEGLAAFEERSIDFAMGTDQTVLGLYTSSRAESDDTIRTLGEKFGDINGQTFAWRCTTIRMGYGHPILLSSLFDDRRPLQRRKAGSAAHRRYLRRIAKGGAK